MRNLLPTALIGTLCLFASIHLQLAVAQDRDSYSESLSDKLLHRTVRKLSIHASATFLTSDGFNTLLYNAYTVGNHIIYNVDIQSQTALTEIS